MTLHRRLVLVAVAILVASFTWPASADAQRKKRRKKPTAPASEASGKKPPSNEKPSDEPPSDDQRRKKPPARGASKEQVFDFTGLELQGAMRTPQLLYFLERASQELDRASLERRSFVPEMVRSIEEERL